MSVRVSEWVFEHSTVEHRGELLVLLVLASHASDDGTGAYPSVATIARKARLTRRGAQLALGRLRALGAIEQTGTSQRGTAVYRVVITGGELTSQGGEVTAPGGRSDNTGGANSAAPNVSLTSPEPSLEPSMNSYSPVVGGRAHANGRATSTSPIEDQERHELAEQVCGILQRGIDGLPTDEPCKPPTVEAVLAALGAHDVDPDAAYFAAVEVREIAQAQNRAPNIVALFARRLAEHRGAPV